MTDTDLPPARLSDPPTDHELLSLFCREDNAPAGRRALYEAGRWFALHPAEPAQPGPEADPWAPDGTPPRVPTDDDLEAAYRAAYAAVAGDEPMPRVLSAPQHGAGLRAVAELVHARRRARSAELHDRIRRLMDERDRARADRESDHRIAVGLHNDLRAERAAHLATQGRVDEMEERVDKASDELWPVVATRNRLANERDAERERADKAVALAAELLADSDSLNDNYTVEAITAWRSRLAELRTTTEGDDR